MLFLIFFSIRLKNEENALKETVILDENKIVGRTDMTYYATKLEHIRYVLFNKHTICFLPKTEGDILYGVSMKCWRDVKNFLIEIGKEDLIVDNSWQGKSRQDKNTNKQEEEA